MTHKQRKRRHSSSKAKLPKSVQVVTVVGISAGVVGAFFLMPGRTMQLVLLALVFAACLLLAAHRIWKKHHRRGTAWAVQNLLLFSLGFSTIVVLGLLSVLDADPGGQVVPSVSGTTQTD